MPPPCCERTPQTSYPAVSHPCRAAATVMHGKAQMKAWLQERLGLAVDPAAPLIGFVGRLTMQKGVDVLLGAAPALLAGSTPPLAPSRWRPAVVEADAAAEGAAAQPQPGAEGQAGDSAACTDSEAAPQQAASNHAGGCLPAASPLRAPAASQMGVSNAAQSSQLAVPAAQPAAAGEPAVQLVLLGTGEVRTLLLLHVVAVGAAAWPACHCASQVAVSAAARSLPQCSADWHVALPHVVCSPGWNRRCWACRSPSRAPPPG